MPLVHFRPYPLQQIRRCFAGHQDRLIESHEIIFLWGHVKDSLCLYHVYHRIYLSCEDELSLPPRKSIVTCCSGCGRKCIIDLTSAVSQRADTQRTYRVRKKKLGEFLFPSICCMSTILYAIQIYRLHEMCQEIMNNPVHTAQWIKVIRVLFTKLPSTLSQLDPVTWLNAKTKYVQRSWSLGEHTPFCLLHKVICLAPTNPNHKHFLNRVTTSTQACPMQHNEDVRATVGITPGSFNLGTRLRWVRLHLPVT